MTFARKLITSVGSRLLSSTSGPLTPPAVAVVKPQQFVIRPAINADIQAIAYLQKLNFWKFDDSITIDEIAEDVRSKAKGPNNKYLVAIPAHVPVQPVVGFVELSLKEKATEVYGLERLGEKLKVGNELGATDATVAFLAVAPRLEGRGIATALLSKACELAKESGALRLFAQCGEANAPVIKVNQKCGFEILSVDGTAGEGLEVLVGKLL